MRTKYKYIEFKMIEGEGKEAKWLCTNHRFQQELGIVEYYPRWKEWEFYPNANTGFSIECLRDIADFLDQLNRGNNG